jgi:hypothetical protein
MEGAPELAIAHRMSVEEYERLTPYSERLEENWGKPPGNSQQRRHQPPDLRPPFRQRVRGCAAHLRLRR